MSRSEDAALEQQNNGFPALHLDKKKKDGSVIA